MKQTGVFNVGLAAFVVLGAAALAVCLALWAHYESRHEFDQKELSEVRAKYSQAHAALTTCQSEVVAARVSIGEFQATVRKQNEALQAVVRERDGAMLAYQAERDAARKAGVAAGARIADLMSRVAPVEFVEQCKALEKLRAEYGK